MRFVPRQKDRSLNVRKSCGWLMTVVQQHAGWLEGEASSGFFECFGTHSPLSRAFSKIAIFIQLRLNLDNWHSRGRRKIVPIMRSSYHVNMTPWSPRNRANYQGVQL